MRTVHPGGPDLRPDRAQRRGQDRDHAHDQRPVPAHKGSCSLFGRTGLQMQILLKKVSVLIEHPGLYPKLSVWRPDQRVVEHVQEAAQQGRGSAAGRPVGSGLEYGQKPIDTMKDEIRAFLEEKGVNYPNVVMPVDNEIINGISGFPTTFFVDSEGTILTLPISGAQVDAYEPTVDQLLAGETVDTANTAGAIKNDSGEYHVIVYDMDGNPVEGAVIQLCDETTCAFQPTDANGVATFSVEAQKAYDIHVLMAPEGYAPDDGVYKTLDTYSDVNIFLEKAA